MGEFDISSKRVWAKNKRPDRRNRVQLDRPKVCKEDSFWSAYWNLLRESWLFKVMQKFGIILLVLFPMIDQAALADNYRIVEIARSQIGYGEEGGKHEGAEIFKYTRGKRVAWCAGFVSWVLKKARTERQDYLLSARSYWTHYKTYRVTNPRPGDVICFYRGSPRGHLGHVGIVEEIRGNLLTTIEGNVGRYPAKVREFHYTLGHIQHLLGFVRIQ